MQEFDATKGLFHLIFANEDDEYYTDSYIKTNFHFYLYYRLIAMKYKYVFFFFGDDFKMCRIKPFDNISADVFDEKYSKYNFINSFLGLKKSSGNENLCDNERCVNREKGYDVDESTFEENVKKLLDVMKRKSDVAVVIPITVFNDMARFPDIMAELKKMREKNCHNNNRHIIVITASVYANESLKYFKPIDNGNKVDVNIFNNNELFPELASYFSAYFQYEKNCYIYDELNKLMGDRIIFFNPLGFENIRRMITHYCLNTDYVSDFGFQKINSLSAVIYAYYNSIDFRCNHNIAFPENPKRMIGIIEESLRNNRSLRLNIEKSAEEFADKHNIYKYICNNYPDIIDLETTAYMIGGSEKSVETEMLKNIKTIYENRCGSSHPTLEKVILLMNKPCIEATVSFSASNFRRKVIEYTNGNVLDVLNGKIDTMLLDCSTKALIYYFDYFSLNTAVSEDVIKARDESFVLYQNLIYMVKKLSDENKKRDEIKKKINNLESGDEYLLEQTDMHIQQLEKGVEIAKSLLEKVIAGSRDGDILKNMENASKNIIDILKNSQKEFN